MGLIPGQLLVGELRSCMLGGLSKKGKGKMDFLGGPVVKNPPANAGDTSWIPGPRTKIPTCSGAIKPMCQDY